MPSFLVGDGRSICKGKLTVRVSPALPALLDTRCVWRGVGWGGEGAVSQTKQFSFSLLHLGALQFTSGVTLSTWTQHQIPQIKGSVPQNPLLHSASDASWKSGLPVLLIYRMKITQVPQVPPWVRLIR